MSLKKKIFFIADSRMDAVFANMPKRPMDEYRAFLDPKRWTK